LTRISKKKKIKTRRLSRFDDNEWKDSMKSSFEDHVSKFHSIT
jgi:hypothetical protein